MKKYFFIVLCTAMLFTVVGCSKKNQVVCTKTSTNEGITVEEEGVFELDKDNKIASLTATYTYSDSETAKSYCDMYKSVFGSQNADLISCSGTKVTIKNIEKLLDEEDDPKKVMGMTKDELIKFETEDGYSCK